MQLPGSRGRIDVDKDLESLPCPAVYSVLNRQQQVGIACDEHNSYPVLRSFWESQRCLESPTISSHQSTIDTFKCKI